MSVIRSKMAPRAVQKGTLGSDMATDLDNPPPSPLFM